MSRSRNSPSPEDRELFRRAIGPLRRHCHDRIEPQPDRPAPIPNLTRSDEAQVISDMMSEYYHAHEFETGEELIFARPGLRPGVFRKLRRGLFSPEAALDLHGMTVTVARQSLLEFLRAAVREQLTCVRIIHGKGLRSSNRGPVLKVNLNIWLRQINDVLGFCSARRPDGGTGAVYVLLKRAKTR